MTLVDSPGDRLLVLCTGNAARSVIAGAAIRSHGLHGVEVDTAGTLVVEGQPMSWRTRAAFDAIGLPVPAHRSRQAAISDLDRADLVIGLAPEQVRWVRREHPSASARTGTLKRLVRDLPSGAGDLGARVSSLGLAWIELEEWEEVMDPGGGDAEDFIACAHEIRMLVDAFASAFGRSSRSLAR